MSMTSTGKKGLNKPLLHPPPKMNCLTLMLAMVAALGGLLFGYDTGIISGAILLVKKPESFNIDEDTQALLLELIVSGATAGAIVGAAISVVLNRHMGRRRVIILSDLIFVGGSVLMALAWDSNILIAGRLAVGIGIGLASSTVPMYISECAPPAFRGRMLSGFGICVVIGQCLAYAIAYLCWNLDPINGWRWMLGVGAVPALVQMFGMFLMPPSPRWLVDRGGKSGNDKAWRVLERLRGMDARAVEQELDEIVDAVQQDKQQGQGMSAFQILAKICATPSARTALSLGIMLQVFQQLMGINAIMYYSGIIFEGMGFKEENSLLASLAVATAGMLASISSLYFIDRFGRRSLLLVSTFGSMVSLVVVGFTYGKVQNATIAGIVAYVMFFQAGLGPIPWTMNAEIYSQWARSISVGIATFINWTLNLVIALFFVNIEQLIGFKGTFSSFAIVGVITFIFFYLRVPETKGRSLEDIERLFESIALIGYYRADPIL